MTRSIKNKPLALLAGLLLTACGGGGGIIAGGGVSGSGIGTISGFGSVIINDIRTFTVDANTQFFLDDTPVADQATLESLLCGGGGCGNNNPGMVARVEIGADVSTDFTSGTAVTVTAFNQVKGPITGTAPLAALEQTLIVTGDTVLAFTEILKTIFLMKRWLVSISV